MPHPPPVDTTWSNGKPPDAMLQPVHLAESCNLALRTSSDHQTRWHG
jgi:hypothetical protein